MDIKGTADLTVAPLRERRDLERDPSHERQVSPGVIVELGRTPEPPGTYNARGVLEGSSVLPKPGTVPPHPAAAAAPDPARPQAAPQAMIPAAPPEAMLGPANAQVQTLVNASPQVAAALRPTIPLAAPHLHPPPLAFTAGIQTLATNALRQAEKGNAAAEHEEEADPLHKDKDVPLPGAGKRRGR